MNHLVRAAPVLVALLMGLCRPANSQLLLLEEPRCIEVAGRLTAGSLEASRYEVGDVTNHHVALINSEGVNNSTGANEFMDGAQVSNLILSDNTNGSGPFNGYLKFIKNGEKVCLEWTGYVRPRPDGSGRLCFSGSFNFINGTGPWENIYGVGIFEGEFTSENQYVVEWKGTYTLNKEAILKSW